VETESAEGSKKDNNKKRPDETMVGESATNGKSIGPPADISVILNNEMEDEAPKKEVWAIVCREARAVSIWALMSPLLRLSFAPLISHACVSGDTCASSNLSVVARWLLGLFPRSVARDMAPGFMFASPW
jgi:hypothetical protein